MCFFIFQEKVFVSIFHFFALQSKQESAQKSKKWEIKPFSGVKCIYLG